MRLAALLAGLAGSNVVLAFAYNWYLVTGLGPGRETDALFAALMAPQLLLAVVGPALTNVVLPTLAVQEEPGFPALAWTFFQVTLVLCLLLAGLLAVAAPVWTPLTVPGFGPEATRLTIELLYIQLLGTALTAATTVQRAAYNARHRFLWPELSSFLATGLGFGLLIWGLPVYGVVIAAWASVVKAGLQLIFLLPGLGMYRAPAWHRPELRQSWTRLRPLLLGSLYYKSDFALDRLLASMATAGVLSLYSLAQQAYVSAQLVLGKALVAPAVPQLARSAEQGDWPRFRRITRRRLGAVLLLVLAGYGGVVLAGIPVLELTFGRGEFGPEEIRQFWWLLVALVGMWVGGAAGQIISSAYYAQGDTRTPMLIGAATFTIAIALKLGGFYAFGIWGLAAATSLYYLGSMGLQWAVLERRLRGRTAPLPELRGTINS